MLLPPRSHRLSLHKRDDVYRRRYLQTSHDSFFSEEAEMERAEVDRIDDDLERIKDEEREKRKAEARERYERFLMEESNDKSTMNPPKVYSKSVFGWHDPLLDPKEHVIVSIDGVDVKWREEEELNTELVDKIFRDNLASNSGEMDEIFSTSSSPVAAQDVSQDSVEASILCRQALENNSSGVIDELNVSDIRDEKINLDNSVEPMDISACRTGVEKAVPTSLTDEKRMTGKENRDNGMFERFIKQTASAIRIQCAWRQRMAKKCVEVARGLLVASGQTAVTILQKWLHIAKINLRIKKVDQNQKLIAIFQNRASRTITRFIRAIVHQKFVKLRREAEKLRREGFVNILTLKRQQASASVCIQKYVRRFVEQCRWVKCGAKEFIEGRLKRAQMASQKKSIDKTSHVAISVIDKIKSLQREHEYNAALRAQCFIRQWLARRKAYKYLIANETAKAAAAAASEERDRNIENSKELSQNVPFTPSDKVVRSSDASTSSQQPFIEQENDEDRPLKVAMEDNEDIQDEEIKPDTLVDSLTARRLFDKIDQNEDGYISLFELFQGTRNNASEESELLHDMLGLQYTVKDDDSQNFVSTLFSGMRTEEHKKLTFQEFVDYMGTTKLDRKRSTHPAIASPSVECNKITTTNKDVEQITDKAADGGRNKTNDANNTNALFSSLPSSSHDLDQLLFEAKGNVTSSPPSPPVAMAAVKYLKYTRFLQKLNAIDAHRDYTIIIDKSASMILRGRWKSAEHAVKLLSDAICRCHSDGFTLYFFSSHSSTMQPFNKYLNMKSSDDVMDKFASKENRPKGGTDLTSVLRDACSKRVDGRPLSILVITDGVPDNQESSEHLIVNVGNNLKDPEELNITIIQVGDDEKANEYLDTLDTKLGPMGAMYDIVDCVPYKNLQGAGELASQLQEALTTGIDTSFLLSRTDIPSIPYSSPSSELPCGVISKESAIADSEEDTVENPREYVEGKSTKDDNEPSRENKRIQQVKVLTIRFLLHLFPHAIFASSGSWVGGLEVIESGDGKKEEERHIAELYSYVTKNIFSSLQTPISKWHRFTHKMETSSSLVGQKELHRLRSLLTGFHRMQYVSYTKLYRLSRNYDGIMQYRSHRLKKAFQKFRIQRGLLSRGFWGYHRSTYVFNRLRLHVRRMKVERGETSSESSESSIALSEEGAQVYMIEDMNVWEQQDNYDHDAAKDVEEAKHDKTIINSDEIGDIEEEDDDIVIYREEEDEGGAQMKDGIINRAPFEGQGIVQSHPTMGITIQTEEFAISNAVEDYLSLTDLMVENNNPSGMQHNDVCDQSDDDSNIGFPRTPSVDDIPGRLTKQTTIQVLNDLSASIGDICSSPYFKEKISNFEFEEKENEEERESKLKECVINISKKHAANKIALALQNWRHASKERRMIRDKKEREEKILSNPYRLVVDELMPANSEGTNSRKLRRRRSSSFGTPVSRISFMDRDEHFESVDETNQTKTAEQDAIMQAEQDRFKEEVDVKEEQADKERMLQEQEEDRVREEQKIELIRGIVGKLKKRCERAEAEERARMEIEEISRLGEERRLLIEWERLKIEREAKIKKEEERIRQEELEKQRYIQRQQEEELLKQKEAERRRLLEEDEIARKAMEEIQRAEEASRRKIEEERKVAEEKKRISEELRKNKLLHRIADHFAISSSYNLLVAFSKWLQYPTAEEEMARVRESIGQLDELITDVSGMMNVISPISSNHMEEKMTPDYEMKLSQMESKEVSFDDLNNSLDELDKSIGNIAHTTALEIAQTLEEEPNIPIVIGRTTTGTPLPWLNRPDDEPTPESPRPSRSDSPARLAKLKALQWEIETLNVPNELRTNGDDYDDDDEKYTNTEYYYDDADGKSGYLSAYIKEGSKGIESAESPSIHTNRVVAVGNDDYDGYGSEDSSIHIMSEVDVTSLLNESFEENQDRAIEYTQELHLRAEKAVRRIEELEKSLVKSQQKDNQSDYGNSMQNFDIILDPDPGIVSGLELDHGEMESVEESSLSSGSKKSEVYDYQVEEIAAYRPSDDLNLSSTDFEKYNSSRQTVLAEVSTEVQDIRTALGIKSETVRKTPTPPRSTIKTRSKVRELQINRAQFRQKLNTSINDAGGERRSKRIQNLRSTERSTAPFTPERLS